MFQEKSAFRPIALILIEDISSYIYLSENEIWPLTWLQFISEMLLHFLKITSLFHNNEIYIKSCRCLILQLLDLCNHAYLYLQYTLGITYKLKHKCISI